MPGRECFSVWCAHTHTSAELCIQDSMAVWYTTKYSVMSHSTSTSLSGIFQALDVAKCYLMPESSFVAET